MILNHCNVRLFRAKSWSYLIYVEYLTIVQPFKKKSKRITLLGTLIYCNHIFTCLVYIYVSKKVIISAILLMSWQ